MRAGVKRYDQNTDVHPRVYDVMSILKVLMFWSEFAYEVLCHNPPLPGLLLDHPLPVLNHDRIDYNTKTNGALVHSKQ